MNARMWKKLQLRNVQCLYSIALDISAWRRSTLVSRGCHRRHRRHSKASFFKALTERWAPAENTAGYGPAIAPDFHSRAPPREHLLHGCGPAPQALPHRPGRHLGAGPQAARQWARFRGAAASLSAYIQWWKWGVAGAGLAQLGFWFGGARVYPLASGTLSPENPAARQPAEHVG